ncbi:hypothetical protein NV226_02625 [Mycoplasma iguanae]|uniref:ECF transporter S component n=1 Tax=Mycoplasma iguanae TaxID=292461 RepID=A0ABY5R8G0_9MOLU|nr:hypothetical protein [Mycoplasma iguanae]UVD81596.1 hypothetical protein NV226_02625 [Mycoplasma iguanae]
MRIWTNKNIAFAAILISVSVVFVIVGVKIFPPTALPMFRFSFIGLPIKVTGLLLGPFIASVVAIISDFLSFLFVPTVYSVYYSIALVITGLVPGLVMLFYSKFISKRYANEKMLVRNQKLIDKFENQITLESEKWTYKTTSKIKNKINKLQKRNAKITGWGNDDKLKRNLYMYSSVTILLVIILIVMALIANIDQEILNQGNFIKNKPILMVFTSIGTLSMVAFIIFARFKMTNKRYFALIPIIVFSAILEPIATITLSYGDVQAKIFTSLETAIISHLITAPVKIIVNTAVIFLSYLIVSPLFLKKQNR